MKTKFKSASNAACGAATLASLLFSSLPYTGWAGSLWREAVTDERGMFADKRAHRLGDIVTIILQDYPVLKFLMVGLMALFVLTGKET